MGERVWHMARANHHRDVAGDIHAKLGHDDWAGVALFYGALHLVSSMLADEGALPKDERHPRKHTAPALPGNGGRGTNQLVRDLYPAIHKEYRSLFEISMRTRYDYDKLGAGIYDKLVEQHAKIEQFARMMHMTRPQLPSDASIATD